MFLNCFMSLEERKHFIYKQHGYISNRWSYLITYRLPHFLTKAEWKVKYILFIFSAFLCWQQLFCNLLPGHVLLIITGLSLLSPQCPQGLFLLPVNVARVCSVRISETVLFAFGRVSSVHHMACTVLYVTPFSPNIASFNIVFFYQYLGHLFSLWCLTDLCLSVTFFGRNENVFSLGESRKSSLHFDSSFVADFWVRLNISFMLLIPEPDLLLLQLNEHEVLLCILRDGHTQSCVIKESP